MADSRTIQGAVHVQNDCKERVAFELFKYIRDSDPERQDSALRLYARILLTMHGPSKGVEVIKELAKGAK